MYYVNILYKSMMHANKFESIIYKSCIKVFSESRSATDVRHVRLSYNNSST